MTYFCYSFKIKQLTSIVINPSQHYKRQFITMLLNFSDNIFRSHGVLSFSEYPDVEVVVRHCVLGNEGHMVAAQDDRHIREDRLELLSESACGLEAHRERSNTDDVRLEIHHPLDHLGHVELLGCAVDGRHGVPRCLQGGRNVEQAQRR